MKVFTVHLMMINVITSGFSLRGQSYPSHGLALIDEIGETNETSGDGSLNCVSELTDCCSSRNAADDRGEFDFPDGSTVPTAGDIRNGYYRNREMDRIFLNRRPEGITQGLFQCRIRTTASPSEYEEFYIGVYDENSGKYMHNNYCIRLLNLYTAYFT